MATWPSLVGGWTTKSPVLTRGRGWSKTSEVTLSLQVIIPLKGGRIAGGGGAGNSKRDGSRGSIRSKIQFYLESKYEVLINNQA